MRGPHHQCAATHGTILILYIYIYGARREHVIIIIYDLLLPTRCETMAGGWVGGCVVRVGKKRSVENIYIILSLLYVLAKTFLFSQ